MEPFLLQKVANWETDKDDSQCEHVGCFQFTKVEDGRCLVSEIQDEIQNWSLSNDPSEAELGTWAAHLASYIGMDELGQTKTLRKFRLESH